MGKLNKSFVCKMLYYAALSGVFALCLGFCGCAGNSLDGLGIFEELTPNRQEVELQAAVGQADWQGMLDLDGVSFYWHGDEENLPCRAFTDSTGKLVQAELLWPRCLDRLKGFTPELSTEEAAKAAAGEYLGQTVEALGSPLKVAWYKRGAQNGYLYTVEDGTALFLRTELREDGGERIVQSMVHKREYIPANPMTDMGEPIDGYKLDKDILGGFALCYPQEWKRNKDGYSTVYRLPKEEEVILRVDSEWLYEADSRSNHDIGEEFLKRKAEKAGWEVSLWKTEETEIDGIPALKYIREDGGTSYMCITSGRLYWLELSPRSAAQAQLEQIVQSLKLFEANVSKGIGRDLYTRTVAEW